MSFDVEDTEHKRSIESDNYETIKLLKAVVFLLEIIANVEIGSTLKMMDGD
jgi:hypothetical protein